MIIIIVKIINRGKEEGCGGEEKKKEEKGKEILRSINICYSTDNESYLMQT